MIVAVTAALWGLLAVSTLFAISFASLRSPIFSTATVKKKKYIRGYAPLCGLSSKEVAVTEVHWLKWTVAF